MPTIDMTATGKNITRMMKAAGMTVKDLQEIFGFATPVDYRITCNNGNQRTLINP